MRRRSLVVFAALCLLVACGDGGGPSRRPGGRVVVSSSDESVREVEPAFAVAPDGGLVVVAWMGQSAEDRASGRFPAYGHIGTTMSRDRGATWSPVQTLTTPGVGGGITRFSIDPSVVISEDGSVMLAFATRDSTGAIEESDEVFVARAPAGSDTFGEPVSIASGGVDRPWIRGTSDGTPIVAFQSESLVVARLTGGTDFQLTPVPGTEGAVLPYPCVGDTGAWLGLAFMTFAPDGAFEVRLARSPDRGETWEGDGGTMVSVPGESVALDIITCVAREELVVVTYGISDDPFDSVGGHTVFPRLTRILAARSTDGGLTFDAGVDVPFGDDPYAMHPFSVQRPDGSLDIVYYAGEDRGDEDGSLVRARWPAGGFSFEGPIEVKSPIVYDTEHSGPHFVGDVFDATSVEGELWLVYGDNEGGPTHIVFDRLAVP